MNADRAPRYRIQAVSDMTGIPAPTLRAWERRYGVPVPSRTGKGYRLYSAQDVATVTRMREFCDSGMSASDAARMVVARPDSSQTTADAEADPYEIVVKRVVHAVEQFDARALDAALYQAQTMGSATDIFDRIISPTMRYIGDEWHAGRISIGQEHLASEAMARTSRSLLALVQPPSAPRRALLACWDEEQHVLPLYGIALRLAQWGYRCDVLGMRTPPQALADAAAVLEPEVIGLSMTVALRKGVAAGAIQAFADACSGRFWTVGGAGSSQVRDELEQAGAYVFGGDFEKLRRALSGAVGEA